MLLTGYTDQNMMPFSLVIILPFIKIGLAKEHSASIVPLFPTNYDFHIFSWGKQAGRIALFSGTMDDEIAFRKI